MILIMATKKTLTAEEVRKIAKLANLIISADEEQIFTPQLSATLDYVRQLEKVDTKNIEPTAQVTGLENVFREDEVQPSQSQEEALANAPQTHNGYILVKAIFEDVS
jgi:aspartyl-tRNA(Asn)/glutamyl-tRNA(Gln) amidotransferase subunit C